MVSWAFCTIFTNADGAQKTQDWRKYDMHASFSVWKNIWHECSVTKNITLHPLCTLHYDPCPLSYRLNIAPPTWLFNAVIKFRNCNWYLPHPIHNFQIKTKTFENACLIMMQWAINSKIQNKMPPCLTAKQGFIWQRSNILFLHA